MMQVLGSKARIKELEKSIETVAAERQAYIASWKTQIVTEYAAAVEKGSNA